MFGSCFVLVLRCVLDAVSRFFTEAASDVSVVDQMDMWFVSLSFVGGYGLFLSFVVSEMDHGLRCGCATEFGF